MVTTLCQRKDTIEKVQLRFIRLIHELKQPDYGTRLDTLNFWNLEEGRNRTDLTELFKMFRGFSGVEVDNLFEQVRDSRMHRHSLKLKKHHWLTEEVLFQRELLADGTHFMKNASQLTRKQSTGSRITSNVSGSRREAFTRTLKRATRLRSSSTR